ncbi:MULTISPECIES: peptidoglycan DD-metalloendopeptidase family protein [Streptomyces]|uniref:Peptidoglycan DD-metalloendopeptidase family protein n=1 Tax=Streptomyces bacillaris TaxID=68179 RepID=A0ABW6DUF3_9ACTN
MAYTADAAIREARKHLGYRETGNNLTKFNQEFGKIPGYPHNGYGYPWCQSFQSVVHKHAGGRPNTDFPWSAGCSAATSWAKSRGRFYTTPRKGDMVMYGAGGGTHVDMVTEVESGRVKVIGGNTGGSMNGAYYNGDGVYEKWVQRSNPRIHGYVRPAYGSAGTGTGGGNSKPPSGNRYRIKSGQTLGVIAALFGTTVAGLLALNPSIKNPDRVNEGQEIIVPAKKEPTKPPTKEPTKQPTKQPTTPPKPPAKEPSKPPTGKPDPGKGKPTGKPKPPVHKPADKPYGAGYLVTINGKTYGPGAKGDHVTVLGRALVKRGFGKHYRQGPGPRWHEVDRQNYADYQRSLGFTGKDADGIPGRKSLNRLLGNPSSATAERCSCGRAKAPAPEPAGAVPGRGVLANAPVNAPLSTPWGTSGALWSSGRHTGADFRASSGTPVRSVAAGVVVKAGPGGAYGNEIVLKHAEGRFTQYAHLSAVQVQEGAAVAHGQVIGLSGSTGNSTGPHLHFELRTGPAYGSDVDPMPILTAPGPRGGAPAAAVAESRKFGNDLDGWIEAARAELAKNGDRVPSAAAIRARVMTESGGNPRAINLTDSNAAKGTPSKGLIQTIDATFQAYRLAHLANDPYDPVSNLVAGVRYGNDRYGSFEAVAFNKGGY